MNCFSTFELGRVIMTYGISEALHDNPLFEEEIMGAFIRYCVRDWSDMEYQEDKDMNDEALATGEGRKSWHHTKPHKGKFILLQNGTEATQRLCLPKNIDLT